MYFYLVLTFYVEINVVNYWFTKTIYNLKSLKNGLLLFNHIKQHYI